MRSFATFTLVVALVLGVLGAVGLAAAQDGPAERAPRRVTELPLMIIPGQVQRPAVGFVLTRTRADYAAPELRRSFVNEVVRSVDRGEL